MKRQAVLHQCIYKYEFWNVNMSMWWWAPANTHHCAIHPTDHFFSFSWQWAPECTKNTIIIFFRSTTKFQEICSISRSSRSCNYLAYRSNKCFALIIGAHLPQYISPTSLSLWVRVHHVLLSQLWQQYTLIIHVFIYCTHRRLLLTVPQSNEYQILTLSSLLNICTCYT